MAANGQSAGQEDQWTKQMPLYTGMVARVMFKWKLSWVVLHFFEN